MKTLKFFSLFGILFLLLSGCSSEMSDERYRSISREVKEVYRVNINDKNVKQLIFINDLGCSGCVLSFSGYILNNIDRFNDNSLIFISSKGRNVDVDKFVKSKTKNIIISRNIRKQSEIIPNLGVVYLRENGNEVDTIVSIDASTLSEQLAYIEDRK